MLDSGISPHKLVLFFRVLLGLLLWAGLPSVALAAAAPPRVLFLGDSLTEGYGVAKEDAYPSLVARKLAEAGQPIELVNASISGSTSASAVGRLRWQLKQKPRLLVLALGANDGLRGLQPAETSKNLAAAIELARKNGVAVLLAGMKMPPNYGPDYTAKFAAIFPALAKKYDLPFVPFLLEGVGGEAKMNQADGIHPNEAGHRKIAEHMLEPLRKALAALEAKR